MKTAMQPEVMETRPPHTDVLETWQTLHAAIEGCMRGSQAVPTLELATHTNTLSPFIKNYIGEQPEFTDITEVYSMLVGLHEAPLTKAAVDHGFDMAKFQRMSREDIEDSISTLIDKVYETYNDPAAVLPDLTAKHLPTQLSKALLVNINTLSRLALADRSARRTARLEKLNAHASTIGSALLRASAYGIGVFYVGRGLPRSSITK